MLCAALALPAWSQQPPRMSVETSQGLFSVLAAINACGYDADLSQSIPLRVQIRGEVLKAVQSQEAQSALRNMCAFYEDHQQDNVSRTLSNYVSLGLNLQDSPRVELRTKEADLPPDAIFVLGFLPLSLLGLKAVGGWHGLTEKLNKVAMSHGYQAGAYGSRGPNGNQATPPPEIG